MEGVSLVEGRSAQGQSMVHNPTVRQHHRFASDCILTTEQAKNITSLRRIKYEL